ncbi:SdrD B-like domain-containing protein, partial [Pseudaquabacterium pictum]|uniref:SdrD B-like domain-containing protein n=5 Tax=Pseudaquabacterium pictum TaxID=2315236 RepID=UPI001577671F
GTAGNDLLSGITLVAGANSVENNFGELPPAALSGYVYEDAGNDGVRNSEAPIAGVEVKLTGTDDLGNPVTATATTDANGFYQFTNLRPGTYNVAETQPAGYLDGKDTIGTTGGTAGNDLLSGITLVAGANSVENNFGELPPAKLSGYVYEDAGNDGVRNSEAPIAGVEVKLTGTDDLGNPVTATATTDANGFYQFTNLRPGTYNVAETQPAGYLDGKDTIGTTGGTAGNDLLSGITLVAGANSVENNFGEIKASSLSGFVYEDTGNDGVKGAGETGIPGVTVKLTGTDDLGNPVSLTTTTDATGKYSFDTLRPGTYTVTETQPAGYLDGKDTLGSTGGTLGNDVLSAITLPAGVDSINNNFGEIKASSLSGFVYEDTGNDGVKGAGETGIPGVTVKLTGTDDLGNPVSLTTTTDATGKYSFDTLRPGTYTVTETQPAGYLDGKDTLGSTGGTLGNDVLSAITLPAGVDSINNNFGEIKASSLSGFVYEDTGNDGVKGAGETGIPGVTVKLTGTDDLGNPVSLTTTTDATGKYSFDTLRPGTYTVTETQPAGYLDGKDTLGSTGGTLGNDVLSAITLPAGVDSINNNFGEIVQRPGIDIEKTTSGSSNSNTTAADYDNEDTANGAGVPILTVGSDVTWTYKVTNTGNTSFTKADVSIVDDNGTVGNTADDLTTANGKVTYQSGDDGDNLLEAGETWLYNATGTVQALNGMGATTTFDFSGNSATDGTDGNVRSYTANGITVNAEAFSRDRSTGAWSEAFLGAYGGGLGVTDSSEGDGAGDQLHTIDNTGRDNYIVFQFSQNVVIDKAFLGYVVCDSDLQMWIGNANSPITTMSNAVLSSMAFSEVNTTTSSAARWAELNAGNLAGNTLIIAADTTDTSPEDFFKLEQLVLQAATTGGVYANKATVTVANGGPSDSDMSHYVTEAAKAKIGDRIWYDKNANGLQDTGEAGVSGVTIDLKDAVTKTTVLTTTTDANGNYSFLTKAGDYFIDVREATLPSGFVFTRPNVNSNTSDGIDSDVEIRADQPGATLQWGQMANTNLSAGETDLSWDAGVYKVGIDVEKYVSGTQTSTPDCGGTEGAHSSYWASCKTSTGWSGVSGCTGGESFNQIFGCNFSWGTRNLFDCLRSTGTSLTDKFMRECVTAYLNACHDKVDYAFSKEQVLAHTKWCADNGKFDDGCKSYESENTKGCNWFDSKSIWSSVVDTQLYDADAPPGLEVKTGSTVTFTYIVKNTGDTALRNVVLTDDRIQTVTYVSGDTDRDGLLDTHETWTYTAKEVASAGTIKNTGTVTAVDSVGGVASVTDKDDAYYTGNGALKSSLGDRVWEDVNGNGLQDTGERGLSGVKVTLQGAGKDGSFGTADDVTATTTTGNNGAYLFGNLDAGQYKVTFGGLTGYRFTTADANTNNSDAIDSDANATTGTTGVVTLAAGQQNLTVDAGLVGVAKLGIDVEKYVSGTLSTTSNHGGSEGGSCGEWLSKCVTTSSMQWVSTSWFTGYWAEVKTPSGWSGVSGITGKESFNQIFGCNLAGGTKSIYEILCGTGTASVDKFLRESVAAYLNACHTKVDYAYSKDQVIAHTKWGVDTGRYDDCSKAYERENTKGCDWNTDKTLWSCVVASDLYDADAPPGLEVKTGSTVTFTYIVKNTGDTALKDVVLVDDRIQTVTYVSGDTDKDGLLDTNETWTYTAKEVASAGTIKNTGTVTAADSTGSGRTVTDADDAYYTGTGALKSSLGDRVWEDKDFDGVQDHGEAGVSGVKVILTGAGKDGVFGTKDDITHTTTTNANGLYEFNNLDAGKYTVRFVTAAGWNFTKTDLGGNDAADSDANSSGTTSVITLDANEHDLTVDAGIYRKASVGDRVWEDSNHNNLQDAGEVGIANVIVRLLNSTGTTVLHTTTTNSTGNYQFSNLDPGSYVLQFDKANVMHRGFNMNAWKWAVKDAGDDTRDSDVTGNATSTTNLTVTSQFTLHSGQSDQTRDAGITPIVLDLDGNGIQTVARADAGGSFDLFGNGKAVVSGWISGGDGFLAIDTNGNGKIDSIAELFGGNGKGDGFAKLASFDSNGDGLVNDLDAAFGQLMVWRDANGNHATDAGEMVSLVDAGVASLTVAYTELPQLDAQGNLHLERSTATLADGQSIAMTDVYFNVSAEDAAAAGVTLPTMSDLLGNDSSLDSLLGATPQGAGTLADCGDAAAGCGDASEALRRLAALSRADCAHAPAAA